MACIYHPDRDSVAYCDQCEAELCEGCTLRVENGRAVCHRCMLALSLNDVKSETTMREQEEEDLRVGLHKKWRPTYIESVLTIALVLVLGLVGLRFYWDRTELKSAISLDVTDPVELLAEFQSILAHYSVANGDTYPESLFELVPRYLNDEAEDLRVLRYLEYNRNERDGYLLRIKPGSPISGEDLIATAQDIYPVGKER
ncbi:MAG: hypothetical protein LJE87_05490 [Deltaproteobacteria bacterium]|nr:hypothetical protein [Deltaproteobacteria bacterium]